MGCHCYIFWIKLWLTVNFLTSLYDEAWSGGRIFFRPSCYKADVWLMIFFDLIERECRKYLTSSYNTAVNISAVGRFCNTLNCFTKFPRWFDQDYFKRIQFNLIAKVKIDLEITLTWSISWHSFVLSQNVRSKSWYCFHWRLHTTTNLFWMAQLSMRNKLIGLEHSNQTPHLT